jgi:prepilin-type N-terminal cleavage/methylation domain-containing protein
MRRSPDSSGFTLVEVLVSVLMLALVAFAVHGFVSRILTALRVSQERDAERARVRGFFNLVEAQLAQLPAQGPRWFAGQPHVFGGISSDSMEWDAIAGPGALTGAAAGVCRVSLELKPVDANSSVQEIGFRRKVLGDNTLARESWVPLMRPVAALQIRYFDAQRNTKPERWTDTSSLPALVYLSLQLREGDPAEEVVLSVPAARVTSARAAGMNPDGSGQKGGGQ